MTRKNELEVETERGGTLGVTLIDEMYYVTYRKNLTVLKETSNRTTPGYKITVYTNQKAARRQCALLNELFDTDEFRVEVLRGDGVKIESTNTSTNLSHSKEVFILEDGKWIKK